MTSHGQTQPFPGINPHLNSALQQMQGDWRTFHTDYLTHIREALDVVPPDGYYASSESSLQIGEINPETDIRLNKPTQTVTEVMVFQERSGGISSQAGAAVATPTLRFALGETLPNEELLDSVVIYHAQAGLSGQPVTRLELLSPANKPAGSHAITYLTKRLSALRAGLRLIELDYLHESRPLLPRIPSYADDQPGARPYHIIVSDPRPTLAAGMTDVYSFGVLDSLPVIALPLANEDTLTFDFGAVYRRTLASSRLFRLLADPAKEPVNFERYHPDDRARIRQRMVEAAS